MNLQTRFLAFCKPYLDRLMLVAQHEESVRFDDWKELQADYKMIYGKEYERTN